LYPSRRAVHLSSILCIAWLTAAPGFIGTALAEEKTYVPTVGQEGKDVVWVPTPYVLVEKMLDVAKVTDQDYVMDLGSGDGRNIIAAAKRGARALGVEYNPDMVELSRRNAAKEGVGDKALFVQGDMYEADISKATVMALFLLSENLNKLRPKFMALRPGSRIVVNGFRIEGWEPDETHRAEGDCGHWCTAYLWIVPANAAGTWRFGEGELTLTQNFQKITGALQSKGESTPIADARLRGDQISFTLGGTQYSGRVNGDAMQGEAKGSVNGAWSASKK
jgi:SAM-dependent methyltransferase